MTLGLLVCKNNGLPGKPKNPGRKENMGYESKLIVVEKWSAPNTFSMGDTIAEIKLSKMSNSFFPIEETFENEIESPVFMGDSESVTEDRYGKKLRYTSVEKLLKVLYKCESEEHYRRTELAINTLKSFTSKDWDDIVVVHYGY